MAARGLRGLARDTRVRWSLEETGRPYQVRLVSFEALKAPAHLKLQPFGQIPTYEEGDLVLFETGAIILHIAQTHPGLLPSDPKRRARAMSWVFCALNTIEPLMADRIRSRFKQLARYLGTSDWPEDTFSAGDPLMVSVLQRARASGLLAEFPAMDAYVARGEARPAYQRAFAAQLAINAPEGGSKG